ncbi:MAG: AAA family ATPase [Candidatus Riflebacteria bacterium]|nr:AAA family ATPase [Candidatus Riflebacteria bacterium]
MINLKTFSFLSTLPGREVENLKKLGRHLKLISGTPLIKEKEPFKEFILLLSGQISVGKAHHGKRKTIFSIDPGNAYGEVEILNGTTTLTSLVGTQDYEVLLIPKEEILRLIGLYPGFAREIRSSYCQRASLLLEEGVAKSRSGQIICFFNVKGGAGKSVISANTALMLKKSYRKKVVLVDLNLCFGDQPIILNLPNEKNFFELSRIRPPMNFEKIQTQLTVHPTGLRVLFSPPLPEQGAQIRIDFVEQVLEILKDNFDFVIVDTQNQFGDLEIKTLELSDMIFLMTTMELTFIKNTKLIIDLLQKLKIPREKVKVVLNRAFKSLGLEPSQVEVSLRYAISHFIPSEGEIVIPSVNTGTPFVMQKKLEGSPLIVALEKICSRLVGEDPNPGTWNMFSVVKDVFGL